MLHPFRPFRSPWSPLLVMAAVILTMAACFGSPAQENSTGGCTYNETTNTCT